MDSDTSESTLLVKRQMFYDFEQSTMFPPTNRPITSTTHRARPIEPLELGRFFVLSDYHLQHERFSRSAAVAALCGLV